MRLTAGESITVGDFEMRFNGVSRFPGADDLLITQADVDLYKNGEFVRKLTPEIEFYQRTGQPMTIPSARSTITEDFYVILVNWEPTSADAATFRIFLNPLINWVWAGGVIFVLGTLIAAWPDREKQPARARRPVVATAGD
jgi:cytochrome c-type biogenesis protein CcmF